MRQTSMYKSHGSLTKRSGEEASDEDDDRPLVIAEKDDPEHHRGRSKTEEMSEDVAYDLSKTSTMSSPSSHISSPTRRPSLLLHASSSSLAPPPASPQTKKKNSPKHHHHHEGTSLYISCVISRRGESIKLYDVSRSTLSCSSPQYLNSPRAMEKSWHNYTLSLPINLRTARSCTKTKIVCSTLKRGD